MSDPKLRDRGRTRASILAAAKHVLAEQGFQAFGVNAVARQAGCDKQLIYRYFGGLDGLADAIGEDLAGWISTGTHFDHPSPPTSYCSLTERLLLGFLEALRADGLVQQISAWELAGTSPLVMRLAEARSKALTAWVAAERGSLTPPAGIDAPAVNAMLIGAIQSLVLSATASGQFAGLVLREEADWARVRAAVTLLVKAAFGSHPTD